MKIVLAPEAVDDLAAAIEYLQERDPQAAAANHTPGPWWLARSSDVVTAR